MGRSTFIDRCHADPSSFHMPCRETTVTLDNVHIVFFISPFRDVYWIIKGSRPRPLPVGVDMMIKLLGSTANEAKSEVKRTKGAHV
jgi:hypothetical protein